MAPVDSLLSILLDETKINAGLENQPICFHGNWTVDALSIYGHENVHRYP